MKDKARKPTTTPGSEPPAAEVLELAERGSVQRKTEVVLRLQSRPRPRVARPAKLSDVGRRTAGKTPTVDGPPPCA